MIDLRAMVNIEDVHHAAALIDPVDDAIGAAPGAMTSGERPEQRLADPVRVDRERSITELQHGGGNGFREPWGDRSSCGRLETDLVPLSGFACHAPVTRRRPSPGERWPRQHQAHRAPGLPGFPRYAAVPNLFR